MKPRHRPDDVRAGIVKALEDAGAFVVDLESPLPGAPDLMVLWRGGITLLELKSRRGKLSEDQRAWHDRATLAHVRVYLVRSEREALEAIGVVGPRADDNRKAMRELVDGRHPGQQAARAIRPSRREYGT